MDIPLKPSAVVDEIGSTRDSVKRVFGVTENVALAKATLMVEEFTGRDLTLLKLLIPATEHEVGTLTLTTRLPYQKA